MSLVAPGELEERSRSSGKTAFYPKAPGTFEEAGLNSAMVESLVLKCLVNCGTAPGRQIAGELGLPFRPFPDFLRALKNQQILAYANSTSTNDYVYSLTDHGRARARTYLSECAYAGTAPVPYDDYLRAVSVQTITGEHPGEDDLRKAFSDLLISEETLGRLGPAINSGRGLFLYGDSGNGKTSIAERIIRCFGTTVWIPKTILVEGQIIKVFDMAQHVPVEMERSTGLLDETGYDRRWVEIRRPTIVAGGELRMEDLELHCDPVTKVNEAPLQLKSNLGTFLIDDFGRQRMPPVELLNRWIVPLEKRYDFLSLADGKKFKVPFDQLIIFSTNLEPHQLVDEAFLRRIPYKIQAADPTEEMYRELIAIFAPKLGFESIDRSTVDYLINEYYYKVGRPFRCCHPRDLLLQVRSYCLYNELPMEFKPRYVDVAVANYFTMS
jgi:predicted ATPase with chaperone activity